MKKAILLVVMLTLAAFVSGAIAAAPPKAATTAPAAPASTKPVKMEKFNGAIKSVDAMAKSVAVVKGKVEKSFVVTADTKVTKGKEALKFEDLKAGMNVSVEYKKEMDKMVAVAIKVSVPKAAPKK
jgi:Cu/Ag efflux protein CusF